MTDDRIDFAIKTMKEIKLLDGDAAATQGIGIMTDARWKATYDFLVKADLLKASTNWKMRLHDGIRERPAHHDGMNDLSMTQPDVPVVEVLSAEKIFANGFRGLAPIELSIRRGEFVSLIGPSGCGKSTLLKLIANLIEPSDGRLQWWRGNFSKVGQAGRQLAFVFQDPTLMPWARVENNVRLPLDFAGVDRASAGRASRLRWSKLN